MERRMTSLDRFREWATSESERSEKPWPVSTAVLTRDESILSLGLPELCCPIFPVDPAPPKRVSDDGSYVMWEAFNKLPRYPDPTEAERLLHRVDEVLAIFPELDLAYVAQAQALARLSLFTQAEAVVERALRICPVRSALCETTGLIKLYQGDAVCFGWFMQACLLGYESFGPYLELAEIARAVGMNELNERLLNACDILNKHSIVRLRRDESKNEIISKNREGLRAALGKFFGFACAFLPPSDVLPSPDNEKEREIELILDRGYPEEEGRPRLEPMRKILDRRGFM